MLQQNRLRVRPRGFRWDVEHFVYRGILVPDLFGHRLKQVDKLGTSDGA